MSSKLDLVRTWMDAAWSNPPSSVNEANQKYLSDNFHSLDKDGTPQMNKEAYLGMAAVLMSAFTGFKWVVSGLRQEGDSVIMSGHFEGKHTGDLDLSVMGMGVIPASGKMIVWPQASVEIKFDGDKVVSERPFGDASGFEAFFEPLGVKLPAA